MNMNNKNGTIYLVQPVELKGTKRFKIGASKKNDLVRCKNGYRKGTRYISIHECNDPFVVEEEVKKRFKSKFVLIAGKEYFEGDEEEIKKEFNDVYIKFTFAAVEESKDSDEEVTVIKNKKPRAKRTDVNNEDKYCEACRNTGTAYICDGVFGDCITCGRESKAGWYEE